MAAQAHRIERLGFDVDVAGLAAALELRGRLDDLARERLPLVIERGIEAAVPADLHIRLDRIELDLGALAAERLEEELPERLGRAFADALAEAIARARDAPDDGSRALSAAAAALEDFDEYLVMGTARYAPAARGSDPAASLRALIERQPEALTALLRRRARDRHVLERLVLQSSEADLRALLAMLAPADAAVILAYQSDLQRLYWERRAPPAPPDLPRALWVLTLEFILRDPGTQFNRRTFLAHLLEGVAAEEGIAYPALLALLRDILEQTRKKHPLTSSLPSVLEELLDRVPEDRAEAAANARTPGAPAEGRDLDGLADRLRSAIGNPAAFDALAGSVTAPVFALLLDRIEPDHAARIRLYLAGLAALHRSAPLLPLSQSGFERHSRRLALHLLLGGLKARLDPRLWLRRFLRGLAQAGEVSQRFLREAIAGIAESMPEARALPSGVAELLADLPPIAAGPAATGSDLLSRLLSRLRRHARERTAFHLLVRGLPGADREALVRRLRPRQARTILADIADLAAIQRGYSLVGLSRPAFEAELWALALQPLLAPDGESFDRLPWLGQILRGLAAAAGMSEERLLAAILDRAGERARPSLARALARIAPPPTGSTDERAGDERTLAGRLAGASKRDKAALLEWFAGDPGLLLRVTAAMDDSQLSGALAAFDPPIVAAVTDDLERLWRRHAAEPLARLDDPAFRRLTWALAVAALARDGGRLDRARLRRFVLAGIARHEGLSAREFGRWATLVDRPDPAAHAGPTRSVPPADLLRQAEHFLRTGEAPAFGPWLAEAARRNPSGFAGMLRRLTMAASGNSAALIDRLIEWMLPEEIMAALQPGAVDRAASWAAVLSDADGGDMASAWRHVLHAAIVGEGPSASGEPAFPGGRHDRFALLRGWLDRGTLAWWAPPGTRIETLLAGLERLSTTRLHAQFGDRDVERVAARLGRAVEGLGPAAGAALIERLAPRAFAPAAPPAGGTESGGVDGPDGAAIRAAAAAIAGTPLQPQDLAPPVRPLVGSAEPPRAMPRRRNPAALLAWLRQPDGEAPPEPLLRHLAELADRGAPELDAALREGGSLSAHRGRWAEALPEEAFARIVHRLAPARARFLLDLGTVLTLASRKIASPGASRAESALRATMLALAFEGDGPSPRAAARRLIAAAAGDAPGAADDLRRRAASLAREGGDANILAALQPAAAAATDPGEPAKPRPPRPLPPPEHGTTIYVANAGLVLLNPFLPRFFERLGVLEEAADGVPRMSGRHAASRAVHLLQYLADQHCDRPEPDLALNKLLCGIPISSPIERSIEPGPEDRALCEEMTAAVIAHWPAISGTSPAGLREAFLQREGRLRRSDDRWTLEVERKTLDVLVDRISWNLAVVYHRWMAEPLHVTW
jgi:hypothetical protein